MFNANKNISTVVYFVISLYMSIDLLISGFSDSTYDNVLKLLVGSLLLIVSAIDLFKKKSRDANDK
jgi:hypothetical protein